MATPRQEGTLSSIYALQAGANKIAAAAGDDQTVAAKAADFQQRAADLQTDATEGYHTLWGFYTSGLTDSINTLGTDEAAELGYNPLDVEDPGGPVETAAQSQYFDGGVAGNLGLLGQDVASSAKPLLSAGKSTLEVAVWAAVVIGLFLLAIEVMARR